MIVLTIFLSSCCELTCLVFLPEMREEKYTKDKYKNVTEI